MGCSSCSSSQQTPHGCKSNGHCMTGGCNKLNVFDWLSDMSCPDVKTKNDFVEVQFKNTRKGFFINTNNLSLRIGDLVITQVQKGYDVGRVALKGPLVEVQMKKKKVYIKDKKDFFEIYRVATKQEIGLFEKVKSKEKKILEDIKEKIRHYKLKMKISDVEIQGDGKKVTVYYSAEMRVDFREFVENIASTLKLKVEMKQIGLRQEASKIGGIGGCGRELCCSSWLTNFEPVNISAARYQHLSLNTQRLEGQCGKLKCCLNYELDTYADALKNFPNKNTPIFTEKGKAVCQKIDIFGGFLWYNYLKDPKDWIKMSVDDVREIIKKNKNKEKVTDLESYSLGDTSTTIEKAKKFKDIIEDNSLSRFDSKVKRSKRRKKKQYNKK